MKHAMTSPIMHGLAVFIFVAAPLVLGPAPAVAMVPGAPGGLLEELHALTFPMQSAHCRAVWHTHRRCVRWSGGVCRAWRTWRHRC